MTENINVNVDIETHDELDKIEIQQLHKATLNFSNQSLETKKLCVTVEIALLTFLLGLYKSGNIFSLIPSVKIIGIITPLLFYIVDVFYYYYQNNAYSGRIRPVIPVTFGQ